MTRLIITIVENGDSPELSSAKSIVLEQTKRGWAIDNGIEEYEVGSIEEALAELINTVNEMKLLSFGQQLSLPHTP
jgi:hypothetical protein